MALSAIPEQICLTLEAQTRAASFPRRHVKHLCLLASFAVHLIVFSLFAVSPTAQMIPSFDIIRVDIVQAKSAPSGREKPSSTPVIKKPKVPAAPPSIAELPPRNLVESVKKQDVIESPKPKEPEPNIIPAQDKVPPPIALASAAGGSGSGNLQNPATSAFGHGVSGTGSAAGTAVNTVDATGTAYQTPMETTFGAPNAPAFIYRKLPIYPRLAERLGREGKVVLKLFIDEQGQLQRIQVIESTWQGFTDAALDAVKKSSFSPGRRNGRTVFSEALLAVRFSMK